MAEARESENPTETEPVEAEDSPPLPESGEEFQMPRPETLGLPPGTLVVDPEALPPLMRAIAYDPERMHEQEIRRPAEVKALLGTWRVVWLNVDGLGDAQVLTELADIFGIHRLALEDVAGVHHRAKVEDYDDRLFLITRMVHLEGALRTEQVSIFVGANFVLTFQEEPGDCLDELRNRIRNRKGRVRTVGPDYLAYCILDAILDNHFPVLERYGEELDELEAECLGKATQDTLTRLNRIKRDLLLLRRAIWPQREMVSHLLREDHALMTADTKLYLRDSYDHTVQLIDLLESYREMAQGLTEVYMSSVSHRMNEVIKVLTIISTIFIPLTFLAGVYGMNFRHMPELEWKIGYPLSLLLMGGVAVVMLVFFWRRGWFKK
jgi:magnesium transporter